MIGPGLLGQVGQVNLSEYLEPIVVATSALASLVAVFFLALSGLEYITSAGHPERLQRAKRRLLQALAGLILVLAAGAVVGALTSLYPQEAKDLAGGWQLTETVIFDDGSRVGLVLNLTTGVLSEFILTSAQPLLEVLEGLVSQTPLMRDSPTVWQLWLVVLGISQSLLVLILIIIGFQTMAGKRVVDWPDFLTKLVFGFLLANLSLVAIDGLISLSNVLIASLPISGPGLWQTLADISGGSAEYGLLSLLLLSLSLGLAAALAVYYLLRLVILSLGAILAPVVIFLNLLPGWQGFCQGLIRQYLLTIMVLFVHNLILALAAGLLLGMGEQGLLALLLALATLWGLLRSPVWISRLGRVGWTGQFNWRSAWKVRG